jgi:iron complex transport system ATP-binding protein
VSIAIRGLKVRYGQHTVLHEIDLDASAGRVLGIVGPNGSGKSTLVKAVAGLLPAQGQILFDGATLRPSGIGYMPQDTQAPVALTVLEVVLLGRLEQLGLKVRPEDLDAVRRVLRKMGIESLAGQYIGELSGGQRQMVFLAQALVSDPKVLLLDEPISALDVRHQLEVLEVVRAMTIQRQLTTVIVLHDLNAAARFADEVVILCDGRILDRGPSSKVLTVQNVAAAFGIEAEALRCQDGMGVLVSMRPLRSAIQRAERM